MRLLPALAAEARRKLEQNFRCLYLNSPEMVEAMQSFLAAAGVHVADEMAAGCLVMSSERPHLEPGGEFSIDHMMHGLEEALTQALDEGYAGLWATGDMTWEFGSDEGSRHLLEYETRLEAMFRRYPQLCGICQYHVDTLPEEVGFQALAAHPAVFVNQTLTRINPHYAGRESAEGYALRRPELEQFLGEILGMAGA